MKDHDGYTVYGWMINKLGLTDNTDLTIYAYLYSNTKNGAAQAMKDRDAFYNLGISRQEVNNSLDRLYEKGLILYLGVGNREIIYVNQKKLEF